MPFAVRNLPATLSDAGFHSQQGFRLMARCLRLRCRHAVDAARRRRVWDPTDALSPSLPASAARGYDALLRDPLEGQQPASAGRALFGSRRIAHSAAKFGIHPTATVACFRRPLLTCESVGSPVTGPTPLCALSNSAAKTPSLRTWQFCGTEAVLTRRAGRNMPCCRLVAGCG